MVALKLVNAELGSGNGKAKHDGDLVRIVVDKTELVHDVGCCVLDVVVFSSATITCTELYSPVKSGRVSSGVEK